MIEEQNGTEPIVEPAQELTLDDLFNEQIDQAALLKTQSDSILPAGTYVTQPPLRLTLAKDKTGRPVANFWAKIEMGDVKGAIGFRLSAVRKNSIDRQTGELTEKPDMASRNFAAAGKAYTVAYGGEKANSLGDLLTYLRDYPIKLRVIQTADAENMVVQISPVRPEV